jgi:hypothetical protein
MIKDRYATESLETSSRDSVQSMINDSIRQSSNTSINFGIPKSQREELTRIAKNSSVEKFKQRLDSIGVKSRYIPEFLEEFMTIAIENGNFDLMIFLNREYNIPLKRDTISWCIKFRNINAIEYAISSGTVRVNKNNIIEACTGSDLEVLNWFIHKGWASIVDHTVLETLASSTESQNSFNILVCSLNPTEQVYHIIAQVHSALSNKITTSEQIKSFLFKVPEILSSATDPSDNELIYIAQCQQVKKEQMMDKFKVYDNIILKKSKINLFPLIKKYLIWYVQCKKLLNEKFNNTGIVSNICEFL